MPKQHLAFPLQIAAEAGPYDERPLLPPSLDLQLHLSRNDRTQPFHLICQHDTVLFALSGRGRVEFKGSSVLFHDYIPGDVVYVPAGTPHRIVPGAESLQCRFRLPETELEGVAWYCERCGAEVHRDVWSLEDPLWPQEGYLRACTEFNADPDLRHCAACSTPHPSLDIEGYHWQRISQNGPRKP